MVARRFNRTRQKFRRTKAKTGSLRGLFFNPAICPARPGKTKKDPQRCGS